jgi:hypothetical protein
MFFSTRSTCGSDWLAQVKQVDLPFWHKEPHLLPDLFIMGLTVATVIFILFHRHRWIILRRFFVIYGYVWLASHTKLQIQVTS